LVREAFTSNETTDGVTGMIETGMIETVGSLSITTGTAGANV
jgi:hypothetical protein